MSWSNPPDKTPPGIVLPFHGQPAGVPEGWVLCDGNNGTTDLRNKFPRSTDDATEIPGSMGGSHSYTISTAQMASHSHDASTNSAGSHKHSLDYDEYFDESDDWQGSNPEYVGDSESPYTESAGNHSHSDVRVSYAGFDDPVDSEPNYVEALFIKKL